MNDDIAIKVENLSKYYRLGVINNGTLFRDIQSWMARLRGKEDPHASLEHKYDSNAEGFWALKDLNFEIKKGDRVGIIGHNGAGKSTLLKLLSQVTSPTEGNIKIKGRIASLLEVGTGFHPELTGRENIFMNGAILGMTHAEIDSKVNDIIEFSEIGEHIDTPVKRYSSGMYVRLAFAVAAHLDSEILIADEVLAVGDAAFQKKAIGKMDQLSKGQGRTVLFVSHQIPAVTALCNKGIFIEKGKIIENGNLNKCVDLYFDKGMRNIPSEWNNGIENEYINFISTSIKKAKDDAASTTDYKKGDIIYLEINYEIKLTGPQYVFAIEIYNTKGQRLLAISASDFYKNNDYAKITSKGKHKLILPINTSIFGFGSYYIKFDIAIHRVQCFTADEPTLSFSVLPTLDTESLLNDPLRCNIINPDWKWSHL